MKASNYIKTIFSRGKSVILSFCILFCLVVLLGCSLVESSPTVFFWDNANFREFTDSKKEEFVITEETLVHFTMRGDIESGSIHVKVFNANNETEILFETTELNYASEFDKKLDVGSYCYLLEIENCSNGTVYHKAESLSEAGND